MLPGTATHVSQAAHAYFDPGVVDLTVVGAAVVVASLVVVWSPVTELATPDDVRKEEVLAAVVGVVVVAPP